MTTDPWADRLSEYVDGELAPAEAAALERHLAECPDCRRCVAGLRKVVERLRSDPVRLCDQPTHREWGAVRRAITAARPRWTGRAAIAAAVLALAVAAGLWRRPGSAPAPDHSSPLGVPADYREAAADLEAILREQGSRLRPETVRAVAASLAMIDSALAQAARALGADPANDYLTRSVAALRDTRLAALRQAVALLRHRS